MNSLPRFLSPRSPWLPFVLLIATLVVPAFAASAPANQGTGVVVGRIKNLATEAYLSSAVVQVAGSNLNTLSLFDGSYSLPLPPGKHALVISYVGLDSARFEVEVPASGTVTRDVDLSSGVYALERLVVKGLREENALAQQAERHAPNPKSVIATSAFGNASANPGELLQRLAGITTDIIAGSVAGIYIRGMDSTFSTLLVDGEFVAGSSGLSRGYSVSMFGTGNLSQVELIKAPTPDTDANAVAGYINLVTRRAFDQPGRHFDLNLSFKGIDRGGVPDSPFPKNNFSKPSQMSAAYSDVFSVLGGQKNLGVVLNYNRISTKFYNEENGSPFNVAFTSLYLNPTSNNPLPRLFAKGDFIVRQNQSNMGISLDYRLPQNSSAFVKVFKNAAYQKQDAVRFVVGNTGSTLANYAAGSTTSDATLLATATSTATSQTDYSHTDNINYVYTAGTDLNLFQHAGVLTLRGSYSYGNNRSLGVGRLVATATGIGFRLQRGSDEWFPRFTQTEGPDVRDPNSYRIRTLLNQTVERPNSLVSLRGDYKHSFATAAPTYVKLGAKYNRNRLSATSPTSNYTWLGADGAPNTADDGIAPYLAGNFRLTREGYGPFPFLPIDRPGTPIPASNKFWGQTATDIYNGYNTTVVGSRQTLQEEITAAYISGNVNLGKLRVLGGVRMEETEAKAGGWIRNQTASFGGSNTGGASLDPAVIATTLARAQKSFVAPANSKGQYRNFFPGLHFIYEPGKDVLFRASYNKSIARPPVASLIPTFSENQDLQTVTVGNTNLKPYTSDNFELSVEKYFEPIGKFSAGVFLKEITNYFRSITTQLGSGGIDGSGTYANYALTTSLNVGNARVRGYELSYSQQFSFLPGPWKGLGGFANYSHTETLGNFGSLVTSNKLPLLTPGAMNAGVSFSHRGLSLRVFSNWRSRVYAGTSGVDFDRAGRLIYDVKAQYRINKRYDIFLDGVNVTNEQTRADLTSNGMYGYNLYPGASYTVGINAKF